jgi:ABC-type dipeptide/oligopeptide/nickel transport system permease component
MTHHILRRLLQTVPVLFGVSLLVFAIMHVVPGDPVRLIAGPDALESVIARVRAEVGLERPLYVQYLSSVSRALLVVLALGARRVAPHDSIRQDLPHALARPSAEFPLGTDEFGRCIISRILFGARLSLVVGVIATAIGATTGILLGLCAGYFPRADAPVMRCVDVLLAPISEKAQSRLEPVLHLAGRWAASELPEPVRA